MLRSDHSALGAQKARLVAEKAEGWCQNGPEAFRVQICRNCTLLQSFRHLSTYLEYASHIILKCNTAILY